ncbi:MAG: NAD(P)/FAD-dependent oxidoreductase [Bryobacterales bacterium]|nr:NAD(P)/FAD-dependent oxidoreductase [Bryobacterales bacterium]
MRDSENNGKANAATAPAAGPRERPVIIIGAGPAGLTAAYELSKNGRRSLVLEKDGVAGGLARTAEYKGYLFDIGGHRFFTKVTLVDQIWREILGNDFITRPRLSRIFYKSRFFQYPLEPMNAFLGLGPAESLLCALSFLRARLFPRKPEDDLETWVTNRFGSRLFKTFFKTYTEKVWGISCKEIRAEWAAQRIRGLSLTSLIWSAFNPARNRDKQSAIQTLIHQFEYPRKGPGMMWTKARDIIEARGSRVLFHAPVERVLWQPGRVTAVRAGGQDYPGDHFISSMPIRELIESLDPAPPDYVRNAAADFKYRDFLTVALMVRGKDLFPDNWIYVHEPGVKVGRIQNYSNWSPEMVPDPETSCLGLEYFCFEGDGLWTMSDPDLIALATRETAALGLVRPSDVIDGTVLRIPKAYPVYDATYKRGLSAIQRFLETVPNLQLVGRNGMHRYNNQDHSMLTAILAARNIMGGRYDLWRVNVDADYHEEGRSFTEEEVKALERSQPAVPATVESGD